MELSVYAFKVNKIFTIITGDFEKKDVIIIMDPTITTHAHDFGLILKVNNNNYKKYMDLEDLLDRRKLKEIFVLLKKI